MMSGMSLILTASALVGLQLAEDKSLATLPTAVIFIAVMSTSIPAAMLMQRIGRKPAFMFGAVLGIAGGVVASIAIMQHQFWLFVVSGAFIGMFGGFGNYFRFAAADAVAPEYKSRAISAVMIGGVLAAILGPNLANQMRDAITDAPFVGSYMSLIGIYAVALLALSFLKLPKQIHIRQAAQSQQSRSLREIAWQGKFIVALICAMFGYGTMSFVMTATPLAMHQHAHSFADTSFVIEWHVLGMYVPSFFTGRLIYKYGVLRIMFTGGLLGLACVGVNLLGTTVTHYWLALLLLGVSWNFLFIGATTLLTETYYEAEQNKAQAMNDFLVFTTVTIASLIAGKVQHYYGWKAINIGVIPILLVILLSILWLAVRPSGKDKSERMDENKDEDLKCCNKPLN